MSDVEAIENAYAKAQAELVDRFKEKLKKVASEVLDGLYTDVSMFAVTDAHQNFKNHLRDELRDAFIKEISSEYGHYSWAYSIRMQLLKDYPDILRNKIIDDLQERNKSLENHLYELQKRGY